MSTLNEIQELVQSGLARNKGHAKKILDELVQQRRKADLVILYTDYSSVRANFPDLKDEMPYNRSNVRVGQIRSGALGKTKKKPLGDKLLLFGQILEFVSQDGQEVKLVARIDNTIVQPGYNGIFLSPFSGQAVHQRGKQTFDDQHNLIRLEFKPVADDYILGMFQAWNCHPIFGNISLVLYIAKSRTITLP